MGKWLNGAQRVRKHMDARESKLKTLERKLALPVWAELDNGASIRTGDLVRMGSREYECILAHTKSNARHPHNADYWQKIEA